MPDPKAAQIGIQSCPGLTLDRSGVIFVDSLGRAHDLETEKRLSTGEVAMRMTCHPETVLRRIREKEIYPVVYINARVVEIYECAVNDFFARKLASDNAAAASA